MKTKILLITLLGCVLIMGGGATVWAAKGGTKGKPQENPTDPPPMEYPFYFWRLGHMDGPHDSSKSLGISRDGKVAVGSTVVVEFNKAWRLDIDWALGTDDALPPLYNELQVQESVGGEAAYAASDMTVTVLPCSYDKVAENFDWCGSLPVGTLTTGTVSYGAEWLWAYDAEATDPNYVAIPDFGGGISDMAVYDVSADGFILVGTGNVKTGPVGFRADTIVVDADGVPIPMQLTIQDPVTLQTLQSSSAQAVSADGNIIAGYGSTSRGNKAFVTTVLDATTDPITLESHILPAIDGGQWSEAYAITVTPDDVIYIAGRSDSPKGPQACIWFLDTITEEWVVKELGGLSKKKYDSVATGIVQRPGAPDGELLVVGYSQSILYPSEAFVWSGNPVLDENVMDDGVPGYLYDLEYILIKTGAGEASGMGSSWILNQATGVALNDNLTARIVGWGINPEGGVEAWLAAEFPYEALEPLFVKE